MGASGSEGSSGEAVAELVHSINRETVGWCADGDGGDELVETVEDGDSNEASTWLALLVVHGVTLTLDTLQFGLERVRRDDGLGCEAL